MSVIHMDKMFHPQSVALIGASDTPNSIGSVVMHNLLTGGFNGTILPVNPKHQTIHGVLAYADVASLPVVPDLAVICTPASTVPGIITELGEKGTRCAVVISAGFREEESGKTLQQQMLDAARPYDLRILGPNCIGLMIPGLGLNASFAHTHSLNGSIALVSQSGAICTSILDWAKSRGIGFSYFISLGNSADVDFGDLLDYLGTDRHTTGILLYVESITHARKFMSAARATSRNKPIIVVKSGRESEGASAATSHTGAMAGNDDVFDAAIKRAGMLRVYTIQDLLDAVETLARARSIHGNRLIILSNGGGIGVLATDCLVSSGGQLAELAPETIEALNNFLPASWSKANPVDIIGDSDAERYVKTLRVLLKDPNYDAILVMLVPVAVVDNADVARAVAEEIRQTRKPVFTCWMGEEGVAEARDILEQNRIPGFQTPESAIRAFMQVVEYGRNQENLMETPPSIPEEFRPDREKVRSIFRKILEEGRELLTEAEAKDVLAAYAIPVVETLTAGDVDEAVEAAEKLGFPVALKILSKDITHKSDVGGVLLDIDSPDILRVAAEGMQARVRNLGPDVSLQGFTVQRMVRKRHAHELIIGTTTDPIFGPVILFGQGGTSVEVIRDNAVALPPLNMKLARDLMERTRVYNLLKGYRDIPAADLKAIKLTLVKISQLIINHAELLELDINPLLCNHKGVVALDARVKIESTGMEPAQRLAIRPYPQELEETFELADGTSALIRPIRPEDEPAHHDFIRHTKPRDIYFRFFRAVSNLSHSQMARFTQIDYDREMAFIVVVRNEQGNNETAGVIRAVSDADNNEAEFAVIVRSDFQRRGVGRKLMDKLIDYCRARGTRRLVGQTLPENTGMQALAKKFGFDEHYDADAQAIFLRLDLAGNQNLSQN